MEPEEYIGAFIVVNGKQAKIQSYDKDHDIFLIIEESGDEIDEWCVSGETVRNTIFITGELS